MGKMILCTGSRAKRPYGLPSSKSLIYSMDELCYYLYHHVYQIEEEMFCDSLIEWIDTELKLPERAQKLKQLKQRKADLKTIVTVIMCSTDYYTEQEIKGLLKTLDEIIGMPMIKRSCIKARICLDNQQYKEAITEYERLIGCQEASGLSPEEYGDVLHNLALAKAHIVGLKEASGLFCQAYERNRRMESLCQYLYSLLLSGQHALYEEKIEEYQVSEELLNQIQKYLGQKSEEAQNSDLVREIQTLRQMKEQGEIIDYYNRTDQIIEEWKEKIR